ncbi:MAG: DMT family transporter [Fibrobacteraceae bacterium]|nr:DMT family transporter [Fibrobacteraceae bacterium]
MANLGYSFLLVLTAFIWGSAFVAQVEGNVAGPFAFTCIRNFIGAAFLLGVVKVLDYVHKKRNLVSKKPVSAEEKKLLWKAGIFCGIALFFAMNLQQLGIFMGTSAGKSGFLTACYIVLVPVLGIFVGRKSSIKLWLCVAITLVGLFFLCIKGDFTIESSDCVLLLCALAFAVQIMVVDRYIAQVDGVRLSFIQFLVSAVLSIFPMIFLDIKCDMNLVVQALEGYSHLNAWIPLLYTAILSTGIAYTLQIVAQNKIEPTLASLLMSLESVFAVLSGWAVLGEHLSSRELAGCALMAVAIVLAQVNLKKG